MIYEGLVGKDIDATLIAEIDRIRRVCLPAISGSRHFAGSLDGEERAVKSRSSVVRRLLDHAHVFFEQRNSPEMKELVVHTESAVSLNLERIEFSDAPTGVRIFEDRDGYHKVSSADREVDAAVTENAIRIESPHVKLFPGRDFRAPYYMQADPETEVFASSRDYTRLASLTSRFLLLAPPGVDIPDVQALTVTHSLNGRVVEVRQGPPTGFVATETVHPWSRPARPAPREINLDGDVELVRDLIIGEDDSLTVKSGSTILLGPGVSIVCRSPVVFEDLSFARLDPKKPWGVVAIHGSSASKSAIRGCVLSGGSEDTIDYVYYSGMLSVHLADDVAVSNSSFADNVVGDDMIRFAGCESLRIEDVQVTDAIGDAIDCDLSSGQIVNTFVRNPHNDGIDLMTSNVDLRGVRVTGAGDKGISFGENASPVVTATRIENCVIGIAIKDGSNPLLKNVEVSNCRTGVGGYDKNWRYPGGGRGRLVDCTLQDNGVDVVLYARSNLTLERCRTGRNYQVPQATPHALQEIDPQSNDE